jgi:hypothetical protein
VNLFAQIKIDNVGEGWVSQIEQSIQLIKNTDSQKYHLLEKYCHRISFWSGNYSSIEGKDVIVISLSDMKLKSIENLSAIIIHESKHLEIINNSLVMDEKTEECVCYKYELEFLLKLENCPSFLIKHCEKMIEFYCGFF